MLRRVETGRVLKVRGGLWVHYGPLHSPGPARPALSPAALGPQPYRACLTPYQVVETNAVMLELPPEKQRLNYRGVQLGNGEVTLGELGVEQDDQIELEFVSPVTPSQLKIIRAPAPEKKAKGGGGKKGKAAGKKKK